MRMQLQLGRGRSGLLECGRWPERLRHERGAIIDPLPAARFNFCQGRPPPGAIPLARQRIALAEGVERDWHVAHPVSMASAAVKRNTTRRVSRQAYNGAHMITPMDP